MFSKNITLKNKQTFTNNSDNDKEFVLEFSVKSNHDVDKNVLSYLENHINLITCYNYTKDKENKK
jgi:hypothetical protein